MTGDSKPSALAAKYEEALKESDYWGACVSVEDSIKEERQTSDAPASGTLGVQVSWIENRELADVLTGRTCVIDFRARSREVEACFVLIWADTGEGGL